MTRRCVRDKRDIIAYITQTRAEANPGGFSLAGSGRPPRAWSLAGGIGALVLAAMWITAKRREERTGDHG